MTIIRTTVHVGYNDVSFPQSQIAISKLSLYPERFTEGTGMSTNRYCCIPDRYNHTWLPAGLVIELVTKSDRRPQFLQVRQKQVSFTVRRIGWTNVICLPITLSYAAVLN